jgi:hypothetical protein
MTEHDDALSLDMVTAALRADSTDVAIYARVLTQSLGEALPSEFVTVDRDRSVSDRMRGRPGEISRIAVQLGDQQMTLSVRNGQAVAEVPADDPHPRMGRGAGRRAGRLRRAERPGRPGPAPHRRRGHRQHRELRPGWRSYTAGAEAHGVLQPRAPLTSHGCGGPNR